MTCPLPKLLIKYTLLALPLLFFLTALSTQANAAALSGSSDHPFMIGVQVPSDKELAKLTPTHFQFDAVKFQYALGSDQPLETWLTAAKENNYQVLLSVTKNETNPKIPAMGKPSETGQWCPWDNELRQVPRQGTRPVYDPVTHAITSWENYTYHVTEASPTKNGYMDFRDQMKSLVSRLSKDQLMPNAIEFWNEPNLAAEWSDQGLGPVNPEDYAKFLACGIKGAKAGLGSNDKMPLFISAALAPMATGTGNMDDFEFFDRFLAAAHNSDGLTTDAFDSIDAFGWHSDVTQALAPENPSLEGFQRVKHALGHGKPVWLTEFGWNRDTSGIYPSTQIQYINEAFLIGPSLGDIEAMFIWNFGYGALNPDFKGWDIENNDELTCVQGAQTNLKAGFDHDFIEAPSLTDDSQIIRTIDNTNLPPQVMQSADQAAQQSLIAHEYQGTIGVKADVKTQFPGLLALVTGFINDIKNKIFCNVKILNNFGVCTVGLSLGQPVPQQASDPQYSDENTEYFDQQSKLLAQSYLPVGMTVGHAVIDCRITTAQHKDGPEQLGNTEISDLSGDLGTNTGFYSASIPDLSDTQKNVDNRGLQPGANLGLKDVPFNYDQRVPDIDTHQDLFYQANFPPGITPFKQSP